MDNLVSVPVTQPCRFLKGQRDDPIKSPDPPIKPGRPDKKTQRDDPIKSPDADPPVKPRRPAKPSVARKLAQEWLEF